MKVRYTLGRNEYSRMTTQELRDAFLVNTLFQEGMIELVYCEVERGILGSAVPTSQELVLEAGAELAADYFCQRREVGVLNIGAAGKISVDGNNYTMNKLDCLYIGRGAKNIRFSSDDASQPAKFYILSYPAHTSYPTTHASQQDANPLQLGTVEDSNQRTIFQYIHPNGIQSCQLVMGYTALKPGSVWNTMPAHTHERRTEVYMYFDVSPDNAVFHFMGPQDETRHIAVHNQQAVISPMWSIHSGCGTQAYSFCWGMGGENQRFDDMDHIAKTALR
ncbi:5-dehydro-4-deoxy-D-glucuronate isomerase [Saccharobesus litoralis]|uniref:4-deoxy-L-threo-5-hexosulose-uronate ketol-isomerase n=1 Tax=Saccharobesus litoralis TaxID=2172099 RepID=A0A2S0VNR0_9ALTE|nr:5-dehydro-4-deoxy-D-glucuronate isomerase [Saccharobesus litoralis]AWB65855.1 5-dehydro-4-deoxy-D-glucuronate isomerase [Saccharobesus litoralis]